MKDVLKRPTLKLLENMAVSSTPLMSKNKPSRGSVKGVLPEEELLSPILPVDAGMYYKLLAAGRLKLI